jgi:hypothetical protein
VEEFAMEFNEVFGRHFGFSGPAVDVGLLEA